MKNILVTGGAGFIGSHTQVELYAAGYQCVVLDNFSNSKPEALHGVAKIAGATPKLYEGDCLNAGLLQQIFANQKIDGVIHFAASKAVGESVENPIKYYMNNVAATAILIQEMQRAGVSNLVFSSSCTVYGQPTELPVTENSPVQTAASPYGNTKQICEEIIKDTVQSQKPIKAISLRYFNPIGAHETALLGELPNGVPSNLVPFVTQTAAGIRPVLQVFGNDYPTPDGTAIRDYIHVVDLARAHVAALAKLVNTDTEAFYKVYNIGTGSGHSVLEVIHTFEKVTGVKVNYEIKPRRSGDITQVFADVSLSKNELGWQTVKTLDEALIDAWRWQKSLAVQ